MLAIRHLTFTGIDSFVLEEHHWIGRTYGRFKQTFRIRGCRRHHHLQSGHVHKPRLHNLRMLCGQQSADTAGQANHYRHAALTTAHVAHFCGLIDNLVHSTGHKIKIHQLDHGPHTGQRSANTDPDYAGFCNWRLKNSTGETFCDTFGHLVRTTVRNHILSNDKYRVISRHFLMESFSKRFIECHGFHHATS